MGFFDKKEEVYHMELTPYGRYLLSIGKLKPSHYKFFDDNIVYNVAAHGSGSSMPSERQNNAHKRIIQDTPRFKPNPNVTGVETNSYLLEFEDGRASTTLDLPNKKITQGDDNINNLQREVGTCSYLSDNSPSIHVNVFNSEITASSRFLTSSNTQNLAISQIDVELNYEFIRKEAPAVNIFNLNNSAEAEEFENQTDFKEPYQSVRFEDGSYFQIEPKAPLVHLREFNSFDEKENFEMKAYMVEVDSSGKETYIPFRLKKQIKSIVNDMLVLDQAENDVFSVEAATDNRYLEYFLDIAFDREIPDVDICKAVGDVQIENIFLDEYINCKDVLAAEEEGIPFDIYATRVRPEDLEDCD